MIDDHIFAGFNGYNLKPVNRVRWMSMWAVDKQKNCGLLIVRSDTTPHIEYDLIIPEFGSLMNQLFHKTWPYYWANGDEIQNQN